MLATRIARTATKLSTKPTFATLGKLEIRVSPYGLEKFPLTSIAKLEENKNGWEITPFDKSTSRALRRGLETEAARLNMRLYFDTKTESLKLVPKKDTRMVKKAAVPAIDHLCDSEGYVVEDIDDDSMFNKRHERQAKAFQMVDSNHMRKRKHPKNPNLIEKHVQDIVSELDVSTQLSQRLGRIALTNKKAMRQILKKITAQETDALELSYSK